MVKQEQRSLHHDTGVAFLSQKLCGQDTEHPMTLPLQRPLMSGHEECPLPPILFCNLATGQYEGSGIRPSANPDPDPDPELRIKSSNSVPDPSRDSIPDQRTQYVKIPIALGARSIPVP